MLYKKRMDKTYDSSKPSTSSHQGKNPIRTIESSNIQHTTSSYQGESSGKHKEIESLYATSQSTKVCLKMNNLERFCDVCN